MDGHEYRTELPQGLSIQDSLENRNELFTFSEMRGFSSCFAPHLPSTISCLLSAGSEQRWLENDANHVELNDVWGDEGRRDHEYKKRSKNLTHLETLELIKERREIDAQFWRSGRNTVLWDAIAESLQCESFDRDAQQCKDKWEKLSAGYKEVQDGIRNEPDFPCYNELLMLFFERLKRGEGEKGAGCNLFKEKQEVGSKSDLDLEPSGEFASVLEACVNVKPDEGPDEQGKDIEHLAKPEKGLDERSKGIEQIPTSDISAVQKLVEALLAKQQSFFLDLLNIMERREEAKEKIRQEREDRWRAEDMAQRRVLNKTMVLLMEKLLDGHSTLDVSTFWAPRKFALNAVGRPKKRSKFCEE